MTAPTRTRKTAATKKAAPAARKKAAPAATKVAVKKTPAKKPAATKVAVKKTPAKKLIATKTVAKKPVAKKAVATKTPTVHRQRSKPAAAVVPPAPAPVAVVKPRKKRPLIVKARRAVDGRALSYVERLEEAMHRQLGHSGPVCHRCRMNASQLGALVPPGRRLAS